MEIPKFEKPPSLDSAWYPRFETVGSFQAYEYLDGNKQYREDQKNKFLSGEIQNPNLDYPQLNDQVLGTKEQELLTLKKDILDNESHEIVKQTYRWRINEKIAEIRMLRATLKKDMNRFWRYSEFLYGKPSAEIFSYTTHHVLRSEIQTYLDSENPDLKRTAQELYDMLPTTLPEPAIITLPSQESMNKARTATLQEVNHLIAIESEKKNLDAVEIKEIFDQALSKLRAEGWQVTIDTSSKTGMSVNQESKQVKVPESRSTSIEALKTLIAHEIGTHVARRINGERTKLTLLGLGLDRYEQGEEGVATMREQAIRGKVTDFAGLDGHFAISLAAGLDGTPRNFREVYTIMEKYFLFRNLISGKDLAAAEQAAKTSAWNRCVRTFRGTDCATSGVCFTKDIVYRQGNIGVWEVIGKNPEELSRFSVGKYDPANSRHIWILDQLGITEKDLQSLSK